MYRKIFLFFVLVPFLISILSINLTYIWNKNIKFIINGNIGCFVIFITISSFAIAYKMMLNLKWRKMMMQEFKDIVNNVKLPSKLPKVVYVYATKNDFMENRLLQNIKQDYSNIEYWISVGGGIHDKYINEIKEFAKKYNINLYILENESKSKADNLNQFLKNSRVDFDYLLIGDADAAFDINFTSSSIKLFCYDKYDKTNKLGYVSSTLFNHKGNNLFTNCFSQMENIQYILSHQLTNYKERKTVNLYSACCLISKKMLSEIGGTFPNSNLEDWYTEKIVAKKGWFGLISPLSITLQSFDKDILFFLKRISRLYTWGIKFYKDQLFDKNHQNFVNKNNWLEKIKIFSLLCYGFNLVLGFFFVVTLVWYISINFIYIFTNPFYISMISILILDLVIFGIFRFIYIKNILVEYKFMYIMLMPFFAIVLMFTILKSWFNANIRSKYYSFHDKSKIFKLNQKNHSSKYIYFLLSTLILAFIINFIFFWYKWNEINIGMSYLITLIDLCLFTLFLYELGLIILSFLGTQKIKDEFTDNKFICCSNKFVLQTMINNSFE